MAHQACRRHFINEYNKYVQPEEDEYKITTGLQLADAPFLFDDFARLRVSKERHLTHMLVKDATLYPDETVEQDVAMTKSL